MAEYVLVYKGGAAPENEEARQASVAAWGKWFGELGDKVANAGNPFGAHKAVAQDGSVSDNTSGLSGFTVVKAGSLDEAVEIAKGCPVRDDGGGVEVYEALEM